MKKTDSIDYIVDYIIDNGSLTINGEVVRALISGGHISRPLLPKGDDVSVSFDNEGYIWVKKPLSLADVTQIHKNVLVNTISLIQAFLPSNYLVKDVFYTSDDKYVSILIQIDVDKLRFDLDRKTIKSVIKRRMRDRKLDIEFDKIFPKIIVADESEQSRITRDFIFHNNIVPTASEIVKMCMEGARLRFKLNKHSRKDLKELVNGITKAFADLDKMYNYTYMLNEFMKCT